MKKSLYLVAVSAGSLLFAASAFASPKPPGAVAQHLIPPVHPHHRPAVVGVISQINGSSMTITEKSPKQASHSVTISLQNVQIKEGPKSTLSASALKVGEHVAITNHHSKTVIHVQQNPPVPATVTSVTSTSIQLKLASGQVVSLNPASTILHTGPKNNSSTSLQVGEKVGYRSTSPQGKAVIMVAPSHPKGPNGHPKGPKGMKNPPIHGTVTAISGTNVTLSEKNPQGTKTITVNISGAQVKSGPNKTATLSVGEHVMIHKNPKGVLTVHIAPKPPTPPKANS